VSVASAAVRRPREQAAELAARLPDLVVAARRLAHSLMHGVHGRRRAGPGENFWQFRPFASGEPAQRIDWRRSARENRAFVREREWESAQTLWLWFDRSATMTFRSPLAPTSKVDRAAVLTLALADLAVRGGERVGLIGLSRPIAARDVIDRFAEILAVPGAPPTPLPPRIPVAAQAKLVLIGDFLEPPPEIEASFAALGAQGSEGHVMMIADPVEEIFPFEGHMDFLDMSGVARGRAPRAETVRRADHERRAAPPAAGQAPPPGRAWDFALHRTDAPAATALLALHARLAEPAGVA
jgi:uncharacterized protein (DUF58 family)